MRPEQFAVRALAGLAVVLVGIGLYQVGSPGQARADRRDEVRAQDLRALALCIRDLSDESYAALPSELTELSSCGVLPRFTDPYSGAVYRFEKLAGREFKVCATMERPDGPQIDTYATGTFDRKTGCLAADGREH